MQSISLPSYAKINLGLRVLGKRADGYHEISTVFQQISICDSIDLEGSEEDIALRCESPGVPEDERNLCWQAAQLLRAETGTRKGVSIVLRKQIPVGAGLGGGSSNAAVALAALNELWDLGLGLQELLKLAVRLGSDVPFFLFGGSAVAEGRGEQLTSVELPQNYLCVLAAPNIEISTTWAYGNANFDLTNRGESVKFSCFAKFSPEFWRWRGILTNDFEESVFRAYPQISELKDWLYRLGAGYCSLSGSGATVFGLFDNEALAREASRRVGSKVRTFLARPVSFGYEEIRRQVRQGG